MNGRFGIARTVLLSVALLGAAACDRFDRKMMNDMPAIEGDGTCRVEVGEPRSWVLLRCGKSCGKGELPEGKCAHHAPGRCPNTCEIYEYVEVCYAQDVVVSIRRISTHDRFPVCEWQRPRPPASRAVDAGSP